MSYLLVNRLNKIEQHQRALHSPEAHFLRESEWLQHKDQIEALKDGEFVTLNVKERRMKVGKDDTLIVITKRIFRDDIIFIDDIFDEDEVES